MNETLKATIDEKIYWAVDHLQLYKQEFKLWKRCITHAIFAVIVKGQVTPGYLDWWVEGKRKKESSKD